MKREYFVSEIMTRNIITLHVNDKLGDAKKIFEEKLIRHIPVVSGKGIIGMLSYVDILKVSFPDVSLDEKNIETFVYDMFTIEQVMTKNLFMVPPNSTIKEVAMLLAEKGFHALPIVEDDELVGIVTTTDLIKFLVKHMD
jgi:CBS domain-containing protein